MKKAIILSNWWEQTKLIQKIKDKWYYIICIWQLDSSYESIIDEFYNIDINLKNLEKIFNIAIEKNIDFVAYDQCDYSYFISAIISEYLWLYWPRIKEAKIWINKGLQREKILHSNIIKQPKFFITDSYELFKQNVNQLLFPIIIKPIDSRWNLWITKILNKHDETLLRKAFFKAYINSISWNIIYEEYIEWVMTNIDWYCFKNWYQTLWISSKKLNKNIVAIDIRYPWEFNNGLLNKLENANKYLIKELWYKFGFTHTEFIITNNEEIYLVESSNRWWWCLTSSHIIQTLNNIDLYEYYLKDFKWEEYDIDKIKFGNNVIIKFFDFNKNWIFYKLDNIPKIEKLKGVCYFKCILKKWDVIRTIDSDSWRHSFAIIEYNNKIELESILNKIENIIKNNISTN